MFIYKITCTENGKSYIGKDSGSPEKRHRIHMHIKNAEKKQKKTDSHIVNAIRNHGPNTFTFEIIDYAKNQNELNEMEKQYIQKFDSITNGYNIALGGDGGNTFKGWTEERRKQFSELAKQRIKLRWLNPEYKQRVKNAISKGYLKIKLTDPKRWNENLKSWTESNKRITHDKKRRQKMSESAKISQRKRFDNETEEQKQKRIEGVLKGNKNPLTKKRQSESAKIAQRKRFDNETEEQKQKRIETRLKANGFIWKVLSPNNTIYETYNLKAFSKEHNISLYALKKSKQGWQTTKVFLKLS